ncbi:MAG: hypothetical protein QW100_02160 [Thermoplasmatales archaeon]
MTYEFGRKLRHFLASNGVIRERLFLEDGTPTDCELWPFPGENAGLYWNGYEFQVLSGLEYEEMRQVSVPVG